MDEHGPQMDDHIFHIPNRWFSLHETMMRYLGLAGVHGSMFLHQTQGVVEFWVYGGPPVSGMTGPDRGTLGRVPPTFTETRRYDWSPNGYDWQLHCVPRVMVAPKLLIASLAAKDRWMEASSRAPTRTSGETATGCVAGAPRSAPRCLRIVS